MTTRGSAADALVETTRRHGGYEGILHGGVPVGSIRDGQRGMWFGELTTERSRGFPQGIYEMCPYLRPNSPFYETSPEIYPRYGAYSTEVFRGAIQSIDKGQFEAAKVLGVGKFAQFYKIILPQMLRLAIPNLSNVWQITLKDTSLISVTGLVEIMRQSYIAAGSTRDPLFFYSFAAVLYLLLTYLSMKLINRLEARYSRGY